MKVLVLSELWYPQGDGAELATHLVIDALQKEGFKVIVLTGSEQHDRPIGVRYVPIPLLKALSKNSSLEKSLLGRDVLASLIKEADVVYVPRLAKAKAKISTWLRSKLYMVPSYIWFGRKALHHRTLSKKRTFEHLRRDFFANPPAFVRTSGFYIFLNPADLVISFNIYATGFWEPRETLLLHRLLSEESIVVDVGANIGWFTLYSPGKGKQVHAFEPEPTSLELLRKSIARNEFSNVQLNAHALGERQGLTTLFLADGSNKGLHSTVRRVGRAELVVPLATLDDL